MTQTDGSYSVFLDWKNQYCQKKIISPKSIYRLNVILSNYLPMAFFTEQQQQKNLKICMETQKSQIHELILRKENRAEGIKLLNFILYYKATVIKTV